MQAILCAHQFSVWIKWYLLHTRHHLFQNILFDVHFSSHFQKCHFCWITDTLSLHNSRIISQNRIVEQISMRLLLQIQCISSHGLMININLLNRHLILCQCSGFIWTDNWYTSKTFHCFQIFDNSMFPGHLLCSHGLYNGHNRAQSFRNRSHRKGYRKHQWIQYRHLPVQT